MPLGHSRQGPNREVITIGSLGSAGTYDFHIGPCEFDGEVTGVSIVNDAQIVIHASNTVTVQMIKYDALAAAERIMATMSNVSGSGAQIEDGVPQSAVLTAAPATTKDTTNYTANNGYPNGRAYREYTAGDRLLVRVIVAGAAVTTRMNLRLSTMDSGQSGKS